MKTDESPVWISQSVGGGGWQELASSVPEEICTSVNWEQDTADIFVR